MRLEITVAQWEIDEKTEKVVGEVSTEVSETGSSGTMYYQSIEINHLYVHSLTKFRNPVLPIH